MKDRDRWDDQSMSNTENIDFSDADTWHGGYYEAAIVLGASRDPTADDRLRKAISAIWFMPEMSKCVGDYRADPSSQEKIDVKSAPLECIERLYGWFQHEYTGAIPLTTVVVRENEQLDGEQLDGYDWLYAAIPLGGLGTAIPAVGGWPFGDLEDSRTWREPIENGLAKIALAVSRSVPFVVAAIGFEVAGYITADEFNGEFPVPRRRGYICPKESSFEFLPTTDWS